MISHKLREEVLWSGPCAYCGDPAPTQVDHILPRSRGGTDDRANLAPACKGCNMEKLDFTPEEYREYREEHGLGWPPKSAGERYVELWREAVERYGLTREDEIRILTKMCARKEEPVKEKPTGLDALAGPADRG